MKPRPQDKIILDYLSQGYSSSTYRVSTALAKLGGFWPDNTPKARNACRNLMRRGLVEGVEAGGRIYYWRITDEGRKFLTGCSE